QELARLAAEEQTKAQDFQRQMTQKHQQIDAEITRLADLQFGPQKQDFVNSMSNRMTEIQATETELEHMKKVKTNLTFEHKKSTNLTIEHQGKIYYTSLDDTKPFQRVYDPRKTQRSQQRLSNAVDAAGALAGQADTLFAVINSIK